jgi:hypothetical protein
LLTLGRRALSNAAAHRQPARGTRHGHHCARSPSTPSTTAGRYDQRSIAPSDQPQSHVIFLHARPRLNDWPCAAAEPEESHPTDAETAGSEATFHPACAPFPESNHHDAAQLAGLTQTPTATAPATGSTANINAQRALPTDTGTNADNGANSGTGASIGTDNLQGTPDGTRIGDKGRGSGSTGTGNTPKLRQTVKIAPMKPAPPQASPTSATDRAAAPALTGSQASPDSPASPGRAAAAAVHTPPAPAQWAARLQEEPPVPRARVGPAAAPTARQEPARTAHV